MRVEKSRDELKKKLVEKASKRQSFENLDRLLEWVLNETVVKGKREIVRNPKEAFEDRIVLVMDRKTPKGVFISFDAAAELPAELRAFLSMVLNAGGCKLLSNSLKE